MGIQSNAHTTAFHCGFPPRSDRRRARCCTRKTLCRLEADHQSKYLDFTRPHYFRRSFFRQCSVSFRLAFSVRDSICIEKSGKIVYVHAM